MGIKTEKQLTNSFSQQQHGDVKWIDVRSDDDAVFEKLKQDYNLHPIHLNESVQKVQHTQVEREKDYLFFVLHFPTMHSKNKLSIGQIGFFLGKDFLITIHMRDCPILAHLYADCASSDSKAEHYFAKGSDYLLFALIHNLLIDISNMTDNVEAELDSLEGTVFGNEKSDVLAISKVRQKIVRLSRVIGPKRFILEDLAQQIDSFTGRDVYRYYSNNTKLARRLWEVIDEARETIDIFKDADFTASTKRTNRTLMLLTLAFTFTIPITVISTMYGMNLPLPGGNGEIWTFLGRYTSFIVIVGAGLILTILMHFYFKKKKWF